MSDTKKYYYMRLVDNYFERTELKIIRQMPKGAEYLLILLKMSCKSFNRGGLLMITDNIPYTPESLSASIGEDLNDVRAALKILSEFSLIEMFETNGIHVKDIQNFIGVSSSDADRKRRERNVANQVLKAIPDDKNRTKDGQMSGQMSTLGQTSTIDRDYSYSLKNIDKDKEREETRERENPPSSFNSYIPPKKKETFEYFPPPGKDFGKSKNKTFAETELERFISYRDGEIDWPEDQKKEILQNITKFQNQVKQEKTNG